MPERVEDLLSVCVTEGERLWLWLGDGVTERERVDVRLRVPVRDGDCVAVLVTLEDFNCVGVLVLLAVAERLAVAVKEGVMDRVGVFDIELEVVSVRVCD